MKVEKATNYIEEKKYKNKNENKGEEKELETKEEWARSEKGDVKKNRKVEK